MKAYVIALALMGCAAFPQGESVHSTGGVLAYGQVRVIPSPIHYGAWLMVQECTGLHRDFEGITWFVADSIRETSDSSEVYGFWTQERHIVIERGLWFFPGLIAHEVLHDFYRGPIPPEAARACVPTVDGQRLKEILRE